MRGLLDRVTLSGAPFRDAAVTVMSTVGTNLKATFSTVASHL
jgi:hypothetical protein